MTALDLTPYRAECRSCRAPIVWATSTKTGDPMPVDAEPSDTGNVLLRLDRGQLVAGVLGRNQAAGARDHGQQLHLPHFVRCPSADHHRRKNR